MTIDKMLHQIPAEKIKEEFIDFIRIYLTPAFGSISKRDIDITLFMKLQQLGVIDKNPDIYELMTNLRITRAKARNLIYESNLRSTSESELLQELIQSLRSPVLITDQNKILLEIGNPYLIDYLRSRLKKLGHISDGSFSREIVKLTLEAYSALIESVLTDQEIKHIEHELVRLGAKPDTSFKAIFSAILKKLGKKIADEAGGKVAENISGYLSPIFDDAGKQIRDLYQNLIQTKGKS